MLLAAPNKPVAGLRAPAAVDYGANVALGPVKAIAAAVNSY
jgi:hypothetical protein